MSRAADDKGVGRKRAAPRRAGGSAGEPEKKNKRRPTLKKQMEKLAGDMVQRGIRLEEALDQLEKCFLRHVLEQEGGNQTRAAGRLEVHRNTLRRKMERHGLK